MASKKILIVLIIGIILCVFGTFSLMINYSINADIYAGEPINLANIINIIAIIIGVILIITGIILKKKS
ncbi:MAG: hypothetical protein KGD63_04335 [Candidatus Lokiarchaeota archaeon]|nr:hypothetical protein [Candidatus Lokiarchaeota archaeon]